MDNPTINLACPLQWLALGFEGENAARPQTFDFSAWAADYGSGVLQLLLQRPGETTPYPVVLDIDGTTATWTPSATDTAISGQGQAQLVYTVGETVAKNAVFRVLIGPSLGAAGDAPEGFEAWLEQLTSLAAETQQSALDAAGSADDAAGRADAANESATSAGQAAATAQQAAENAAEAQQAAESAQQNAETNAALAGGSAAAASAIAEAAGDSATAAWNAQAAAEAAAETAGRNAGLAAGSAADAASSAGAAASSAAEAASTVAGIESAGAAQVAAVEAAGTIQAQAVEEKGAQVLESIPEDYTEALEDIAALQLAVDGKAPAITETVGPAAICSFSDGADGMPVRSLTVNITPVQSGSGDPGPDNVRPITGWTGAKINVASKNLFGGSLLAAGINARVPSATDNPSAGTISFSAGASVDGDVDGFTGASGLTGKFKADTQYTFILTVYKVSGTGTNMRVYYTDGSTETIPAISAKVKTTLVFVSDAGKTVSRLDKYNSSSTTRLYYNESGVFDGLLTADDFVPYVGEPYTVSFPAEAGTVYGGALTIHEDGSARLSACPYYASYDGETLVGPWISSMDVYAEGAVPTIGAQVVDLGGEAAVYDLTVEQLRTLYGTNNIWADAGDVTVEYPADTKLYIDNKIAAAVAALS